MSALTEPIRDALAIGRFRYGSERDLQHGISQALDHAGITWEAEVVCDGGRIDFVVGRVGVEVKVKGSEAALRRQLTGYSADSRFDAFLVVTTRRSHRAVSRFVGDGKPVDVLVIGGLG